MSEISDISGIQNLYIPKVELKDSLKKIMISGVSRMPDPSAFYSELATELEDAYHKYGRTLFVNFYFEYINTGSSKWLYYLMRHLENISKQGGIIEVTWQYDLDDESIEMTGEVLKSQVKIPVKLEAVGE